MSSESPFLCAGCPGKGDARVDFDAYGGCPYYTVDAFKQTRRYRIEHPQDYESDEAMAEISAGTLRYFDPEADDYFERSGGDINAAHLGIACAERWLAGRCPKSASEIISESEID